ncbi:response regulator transcription factor [Planctomycetota bacterium]
MEENTILIIEDEPELAAALKLRLEKAGYGVSVASDGEEGLARAEQDIPSLIVLDVLLPGVDGYEVCRRLKSDKRYSDIPIVMLTVRFQEEDAAKGYRVGADEYVTKPFEWDYLLAKVKKFVGARATVLICDDEPDIVKALQVRFESEGYDVITASNGDEFLEKAQSYSPNIAILDIMMPGKDGFETCRCLKQELGLDMPVILLTVKSESSDISKGVIVGADAYITKPFDPQALLQNVRMLLEPQPKE